MKPIERLQQYIEYKGISINSIDSAIGMGNGYMGKYIKNKGSIGSDILEKIFSCFPDLNPTWLLTGKGIMLIRETSDKEAGNEHQINNPYITALLDKLPADEIIAYIQVNEKRRGFDKSELYRMFLEIRIQDKVCERMKELETKVDELFEKQNEKQQ